MPPGHVWLTIGSCDFSSDTVTTEAFGEAAMMEGAERVEVSFGFWLGDNLHITAEVGGVGVGLGKLAIESNGVVPRQFGDNSKDCTMDPASVNDLWVCQ